MNYSYLGSITGFELPEDDREYEDDYVDAEDLESPARLCMRPDCTRPMTMSSESGNCLECALEGARDELLALIRTRPFPMTTEQFRDESMAHIEIAKLHGAVESRKRLAVAA